MRIAFVGQVCVDSNVVKGRSHTLYGGGVVHGSITSRRLGAEASVTARCAPGDRPGFEDMQKAGVVVRWLDGDRSTSIRNEYPSDNPDDRISRVLSRADPFQGRDLTGLTADVLHVNPLWLGEFPPEMLETARGVARVLAADAQGFVRVALEDGRMIHRDWPDKERFLPLLDVFKVDLSEAQILTGLDQPRPAARRLVELGARTVLLTHRDGVCADDGKRTSESVFTHCTLEGRTGRGDTCTAAFLVGRATMDLPEATAFAARITSEKMRYPGAYRGDALAG